MTPGRSRALSWAGTALAAALLLVAAGQGWVRVSAEQAGAGTGTATASISGTSLTGGLSQALAVVPPLGLLLALTLRARGRQVVGVLLVLVGLAALLLGLAPPAPTPSQVRAALGTVSLAEDGQLTRTGWPWVFALGGLLLLLSALLMVRHAPRWASRAGRYERPGVGPVPLDPDDPATAWRALDRGEDPTEPPADLPGRDAGVLGRDPVAGEGPISREGGGGDRMATPQADPTPDDRREGRP